MRESLFGVINLCCRGAPAKTHRREKHVASVSTHWRRGNLNIPRKAIIFVVASLSSRSSTKDCLKDTLFWSVAR